ncbi:hypothetical protein BsWGS_26447 [Bradybaena similaris]
MADTRRSEDAFGEKVDRCLYNSIINFAGGVVIGIGLSALVFKRKLWPVILGGGIGSGMAVSYCKHEFDNKTPLPKRVESVSSAAENISQ